MNAKPQLPLLLLLLWSSTLLAQPKISVKSFERKDNDMTARTDAPKKDQNGDVCAIIKVVTDQTGFIWEPDGLGIVSAEYKKGEYWLYVPYGAKRLTIKHDKLGILRDYFYPIPIEKSVVYVLVLSTGKVTTTVEPDRITSQWLVINSEPTGADIFIDDQPANQTPYQNELPIGKHTYRLSHNLYLPTAGIIELTADKKETVNLTMKPKIGMLKIITKPTNATITLNGENKGTTPANIGDLMIGNYTLTLTLPGYATIFKKIIITEGETAQVAENLEKGRSVSIDSKPSSVALSIDGYAVGQTPYSGNLSIGSHTLQIQEGEKKGEKTISISRKDNEISFNLSFESQSFTETINGVSFDMVAIKGGTFWMGSNDRESHEKPGHIVTVDDFSIGKTEVTQAQWVAIMGSNPSSFKGDNLPVESVSWNVVEEFIGKLNEKTGKTYRLPTEAEWEYAAGGGITNRSEYSGTKYESMLDEYAWYSINSNRTTHAVGIKKPNQLGLYDMSGNVEEWCSDWYGSYTSLPQNNPKGASIGSSRVLRGGDYLFFAKLCRVSSRHSYNPDSRSMFNGFRLVISF